MPILALLLWASASRAAEPDHAALRQARRCVETAVVEVARSSRARGAAAERRALAVTAAGRDLLGRGYNVVEAEAILERMFVWLASLEARSTASADSRELLERAARHADPQIGDGPGVRGAAHWARFVLTSAESAAGLPPVAWRSAAPPRTGS